MNDKKQEPQVSGNDSGASLASTKRAEKVRSSRFEWEAKSGEADTARSNPNGAQTSLMTSIIGWLVKLLSGSRNFFDNDDDATPSAA